MQNQLQSKKEFYFSIIYGFFFTRREIQTWIPYELQEKISMVSSFQKEYTRIGKGSEKDAQKFGMTSLPGTAE